jgi:hypothetical protein
MFIWWSDHFFDDTLELCREGETSFNRLGDLKNARGEPPFQEGACINKFEVC